MNPETGLPELNSVGDLMEFTGYAMEHENFGEIIQYGTPQYAVMRESFKAYQWEPPKEIDPRPWFDVHNQGAVGSCQGQSLADAGEYLALLVEGKEIQLSRGFAYCGSQEFDGLLGRDSGSTLSGGTRAAARGIPLESASPYVANYRSLAASYRSKRDELLAGEVWKFPGAVPLHDHESAYRFLSSWMGPIHIGIAWGLGSSWELDSYRFAGGGHAVLLPGYLIRHGWPLDIGFLLKNSWGPNYGRDGWALLNPRVYDQMFGSRRNVAIGRTDMVSPRPRRERIDHARHYFDVLAA